MLLPGLALFFLTLAAHVVLWRWRRPRRHTLALFALFAASGAAFAALAPLLSLGALEIGAAELLHFSLAAAYIQTYPSFQAISPSLVILQMAAETGANGITLDQIESRLGSQWLLGDRLEDLLSGGLVAETPRGLEPSPSGRWLVAPFILLRKILGLGAGLG